MKRLPILAVIAMVAACATSACAANSSSDVDGSSVPMQSASGSQNNQPNAGATVMRKLAGRFPGATLLDEAQFTETIQGHSFRYQEVGSDLVIDQPAEVFLEGGRYSMDRSRFVTSGTYSLARGVVLIDCPQTFLGLSRARVFFRYQDKLFTANAEGDGSVIELIPRP